MRLRKAEIDLSALRDNYKVIKTLAPESKVLAMIKSDAYGHGLLPAAKALSDADAFGVSVIEEAITLRDNGITQRILLMTGVQSEQELDICIEKHIDIVVHTLEQIEMLEKLDGNNLIAVWLKFDVGMHRLGFNIKDADMVYQRLNAIKAVTKPIVLMSHLSNADQLGDGVTNQQMTDFRSIANRFDTQYSLAKSAGILAWPESHYDWVRPGIMLYGISPFQGKTGEQHGLKPVMSFHSTIIAIKELKAGDPVSYGGTWRCPEDMKVGIVGVGYSDGYPRHAPSGTPILVNGKRCQLVGRVCMDMLTVDLRPAGDVKIGDEVILWGKGLPIESVAEKAGTIAYEIICHVSDRVKQVR